MDEPFVGLDPVAAHQLKNLMAEHCAAGGAIFFSTHVLEVAEKAVQQGRDHPGRQAGRLRRDGRGARRFLAGGNLP